MRKAVWRLTALLLVPLMGFPSVPAGFASVSAPASVAAWREVADAWKPRRDGVSAFPKVSVPHEFGLARKAYVGGSDRILVNIQDAHSELGAQETIAKILESLVKNYGVKLVFVEGASGRLDPSTIAAFPVEETRRVAAEHMMREGMVSAAEYYAMASAPPAVKFYGAEDPKLYEEHLQVFRKIMTTRAEVRDELKGLSRLVRRLEDSTMSPELLDLTRRRLLRTDGDVRFTADWERFRSAAAAKNMTLDAYPNLRGLETAIGLEAEIDFRRAAAEREALIGELGRRLKEDVLKEFILEMLRFKQNKSSAGTFHHYLARVAAEAGVGAAPYANLILYSRYLVEFENLDLVQLVTEVEEFEAALRDAYSRTEDEKKLSALSRRLDTLTQLLALTLQPKGYREYAAEAKAFSVETIEAEVSELSARHRVTYEKLVDFKAIGRTLPHCIRFYELAEKRNEALTRVSLERMRTEKASAAVLVTGGFHSEGISRILEKDGVTHLVVMPKFEESAPRPYYSRLAGKPKAFEESLRPSVPGSAYLADRAYTDTAMPHSEADRALPQALLRAASRFAGTGGWDADAELAYRERFKASVARVIADGAVPFDEPEAFGARLAEMQARRGNGGLLRVAFPNLKLNFDIKPDGNRIATSRLAPEGDEPLEEKAPVKKEAPALPARPARPVADEAADIGPILARAAEATASQYRQAGVTWDFEALRAKFDENVLLGMRRRGLGAELSAKNQKLFVQAAARLATELSIAPESSERQPLSAEAWAEKIGETERHVLFTEAAFAQGAEKIRGEMSANSRIVGWLVVRAAAGEDVSSETGRATFASAYLTAHPEAAVFEGRLVIVPASTGSLSQLHEGFDKPFVLVTAPSETTFRADKRRVGENRTLLLELQSGPGAATHVMKAAAILLVADFADLPGFFETVSSAAFRYLPPISRRDWEELMQRIQTALITVASAA